MTETLQIIRAQLIELLPRLRRFALTLTRHREDADDVVQIALEKALVRHAQWDPQTRLDSWMFSIIRNSWIDEVRQRQRRGQAVDLDDISETIAAEPADATADRLSVRQALAMLPEQQRTAVSLVLVEGLAYKEAADVMQIPIGTLTSRLARGREALQNLLGGSDTL